MWRQRALKIVLVLVGLFFSAAIYPLIGGLRDPTHSDTGDTMMMSLYFALGVFLLVAVRNPSVHRSVIAFAAWSSFAHAVNDDDSRTRNPKRARGISGRVGSACGHRCSPDRSGSGEAISRERLRCGGVGSP
jgi:hypothetical protein